MKTEPRIYVACLASYNAGKLVGEWLDATLEPEELHEAIAELLSKSKELVAEEWAIHDHEGFGDISIGEYESMENVSRWANLLVEHGEAFGFFVGSICGTHYVDENVEEQFQEAYCGCFESEKAFAESCVDEGLFGDVPEHLANYIDYDAIARDLFCGDHTSCDGSEGCHVFRSC